jgi:hypothetical protein
MTKHTWKTQDWDGPDGDIDLFAYEAGYHNGPECADCGFFFCHHCDPDGYETECGEPARPGDPSKIDPIMDLIRGEYGLPPEGDKS